MYKVDGFVIIMTIYIFHLDLEHTLVFRQVSEGIA